MRPLPSLAFSHCSRDGKQYFAQPFTNPSPVCWRAKTAPTYQIPCDTLLTLARVLDGSRLRFWVHLAGNAGCYCPVHLQCDGHGFCAETMAGVEYAAAQAHHALQEGYESEE